jgi:hypothetical protein
MPAFQISGQPSMSIVPANWKSEILAIYAPPENALPLHPGWLKTTPLQPPLGAKSGTSLLIPCCRSPRAPATLCGSALLSGFQQIDGAA